MKNENIKNYLEEIVTFYLKKNFTFPALGIGVVLQDGSILTHADGLRKKGTTHKTKQNDIFALGSIGKPLTGYLFAILATKNNKLKAKGFDTTIGDIFDDILKKIELDFTLKGKSTSNIKHYRKTTVAQLMSHISGLDYQPQSRNYPVNREILLGIPPGQSIRKRRELYIQFALEDYPFGGNSVWHEEDDDGKKYTTNKRYSGGCIIVASMIERVMNKSWETLIKEYVFNPLKITQFRFEGTSNDAFGLVTGTQQHTLNNGKFTSHGILPTDVDQRGAVHGPAGKPNMSMQDFGKWIRAVLHNNKSSTVISTFNRYFAQVPTADFSAGGWVVSGNNHWHNGSQEWNYSFAEINRQNGYGAYAFTNIANDVSKNLIHEIKNILMSISQIQECFRYDHQSIPKEMLSIATNKATSGRHIIKHPLVGPLNLYKSANSLPIMTISFSGKKWIKGIVMGAINDKIKNYNINVIGQNVNSPSEKEVLIWNNTVKNLTTISDNNNTYITLFSQPKHCTHIEVDFPNSQFPLSLEHLSILEYKEFEIKNFDIDQKGHLWIVDKAGKILTSKRKIGAITTLIDHDTKGVGTHISKANGMPFTIDKSGNAWFGMPNGWIKIEYSKKIIDIAIDPKTEIAWAIDVDKKILKLINNKWIHYGGQGRGKAIRVFNNTIWVIGMDNSLWKNVSSTNWQQMLNTKMKDFAISPDNHKIWFIDTSNKIKSWTEGAKLIMPHPASEGRAKKIKLYNGIPYVIGMDNTIWKSAGNSGWKRLNIFNNL